MPRRAPFAFMTSIYKSRGRETVSYVKVTKELDAFDLPWGKKLALQEVEYEGGLAFLRLRIREGNRFTLVDIDRATAARLGDVLTGWRPGGG